MAVLTFSQEAGSGGTEIAKRAAKELGYLFVDKGVLGDLLAQYGLVGFQRVYDSAPAFWESFDSQKMEERKLTIEMMNRTILAIAHHDRVVIAGRGSYLVLAGYADVINIRIQASFDSRAARIMRERHIDTQAEAERRVHEMDAQREQFIESAYGSLHNGSLHNGSRLDSASRFNIVLDTDLIPADRAVPLITAAARALESADFSGLKNVASIAVETVLQNVIAELFAA